MILCLSRFRIVAGPNPGADSHGAESRLRAALVRAGATRIEAAMDRDRQYTFEIEADAREAAFARVTGAFRSVYGLEWWAEVVELEGCGAARSADLARQAMWN